jgi:class 3 adenylate cyclase/tetratricopeptide (TPR) repeat protein
MSRDEVEGLKAAIAELESRRSLLGDATVEASLAPLRARLAALAAAGALPSGKPAAASRDAGAERKIVTALFADFEGFTRLVASGDPEEVRDLVGSAFGVLVPVIERFGGTIEKFIGDGVMALFGAPRAHGDDPRRACLAALAMIASLQRFNERRGSSLAMHIGVGTGIVVAGSLGVAGHHGYSAVGSAVNRAARISSLATGGQVLMDSRTAELAGPGLSLTELEPAKLKGFEEAVRIFALGGRQEAEEEVAACLDFTGREADLATLDDAWRPGPGERALVAIEGEPGIGKTRLATEWRQRLLRRAAGGEGPFFVEARGSSFETASAYRVLADLVEGLAGVQPLDSPRDRAATFKPWLAGLGLDEEDAQTITALVEAGDEDEAEGGSMRPRFRDPAPVLSRLLASLAGARPLVFIADDWQAWDGASAALVLRLAEGAYPRPSCWLVLARDEAQPFPEGPHHGSARVRRLSLGPLSPAEIASLVAGNEPPGGMSAAFAEELERAGGNPLFIEEVLARAREGTEPLPCDPELASSEACGLSPALFGLVTARIDALPPYAREAARMAAVLGDRFPRGLLESLAGAEGVSVLTLRGILTEGPEEGFLSFRNGLVREATYATLVERARRELHGRAALSIRDGWPEYASRRPDLLARHWHRAGEPRKALPHYRAAGEALYWRRAWREAENFLTEGLGLAYGTGSTIATAEFLVLLGRCEAATGKVDSALAHFREARDIYRGFSNRSKETDVLRAESYALARSGHPEEAEPSLREALALATETGNLKDQAQVLGDLAELLRANGDPGEALGLAERSLQLAEATKLLSLYRRMLFARADCLECLGRGGEAQEAFLRCAEVCALSGEERLKAEAERRAGGGGPPPYSSLASG